MWHQNASTIHKGAYVQSLDPGAVGAKVLWVDTTSGYVLKKRNDTNDGWDTITLGSVSGTLAQDIAFSGDITPAQITADQNNYNPTGLSTASTLRLNSDASRNITGLAGGADGRLIAIHNVGSNNIVLKDEDPGSSAANRFAFSGDLTIGADQGALLQYDSTSSRWRLLAGPAAASSGMTNPMTTAGDIITGGASGTPQRLAVGSEGQALRVSGGAPSWQSLPSPGGSLADPLGQIVQWQVARVNGIDAGFGGNGTGTEVGTSTSGSDADGMFENWATQTTVNTEAGVTQAGGPDMTQLRYFPIWYAKIKTSSTSADFRFFLGLTSATTIASSDTAALSYVAFRVSTSAGDTNWKCVSDDGSGSPTVVDSGIPYATATVYHLKIDCSDPASIKFYINGSLVATLTTTLPAASTNIAWISIIRNLNAGTARSFNLNRMVLSMP